MIYARQSLRIILQTLATGREKLLSFLLHILTFATVKLGDEVVVAKDGSFFNLKCSFFSLAKLFLVYKVTKNWFSLLERLYFMFVRLLLLFLSDEKLGLDGRLFIIFSTHDDTVRLIKEIQCNNWRWANAANAAIWLL